MAEEEAVVDRPTEAEASPDALNGDSFKKPLLPLAPLQKKEKTIHSRHSSSSTETSENVKFTEVSVKNEVAAAESFVVQKQFAQSNSEGNSVEDQPLIENLHPKSALPLIKSRSVPSLPSDKYKSCPPLPYVEPPWGGLAETPYSFEVLKNGSIVSDIGLNLKSFYVVGRLPVCDISLEHPSISRYHAVVQHRRVADGESGTGFYIYDLGSTHGTTVNKEKVKPQSYHRLKVGHVIKFGGSTRLLILQGPEEDEEAESEFTVTELKQMSQQHEQLEKRMLGEDSDEEDNVSTESVEQPRKPVTEAASGCTWGIVEDAVEDESEENPYSIEFQEDREAFYIKDPKKALQGFFDREGEELEYEYDERGSGTWVCRVRLPVTDAVGNELVAEVTHAGKKKEAMVQCSLEACRILDARGVLRLEAVSRKRKSKNWEAEDFYDSDEDTFLDRTGVIEKKRFNRMKKAGKIEEKVETYDSLVAKLADVERKLSDIESNLKRSGKDCSQPSGEDSLDAFMTDIKMGAAMDSVTRKKLHIQSFELKKEQQRLWKLIKIVTPVGLPELKTEIAGQTGDTETKAKKIAVPIFGAMKGGKKFKLKTGTIGRLPPKRPEPPSNLFNMKDSQAFEAEEEEEEEQEQEEVAEEKDKPDSKTQDQEMEQQPEPFHSKDSSKNHNQDEEIALTTQCAKEGETARAQLPEHQEDCKDLLSEDLSTVITESKDMKSQGKSVKKKMYGPKKPPQQLPMEHYPSDDPDYCVWMPPAGQTGDGRTHLNDKYGY
ncbi:kanadaptin isoform X1 [Hypanus sabinus]|uniref:kanadaptin isoform X1 n=1 Tax=Hypanus sabinus TaxID=79690 RepID=UPI0028C37B6D|nr:kanadaptin isoform X1 [Hypanus sabinus]